MRTTTRVVAVAAGFVVMAAMAIGAASAQDTMKKDDMKHDDMAKMKGGSPDQKFVMMAAIGGMEEVQLGQMAADKGTSAEVKQFGQHMVEDHSKANDELKTLAASKNITLPTALDAKHQADVDKLSKLSGADFDRTYVKMMVQDHNKDVGEFDREATRGKDPDVKAWAAKTLPTLRSHQSMIKNISDGMAGHGDMKSSK
jgi:putative membrane protein